MCIYTYTYTHTQSLPLIYSLDTLYSLHRIHMYMSIYIYIYIHVYILTHSLSFSLTQLTLRYSPHQSSPGVASVCVRESVCWKYPRH